ncbi:hypothetical protein [Burkholderia ubonensis]|uniref:hypothetical protein n=1 Tax=Burkholderia ubonensis TaxID=101571 RepID=UPI00075AAE80|nr:hypothetical protein [Burkholderia ubonensis]KVL70365.1 hypothetical protein WJ49_22910 [Burkholderia ubonensis]KVL73228.1 hypothetical protein WJ48_00605 [Burkholderia ubonensis]KVL91056.1 hypothetical protein WJ50_13040 [Burkholderia ubonensis]
MSVKQLFLQVFPVLVIVVVLVVFAMLYKPAARRTSTTKPFVLMDSIVWEVRLNDIAVTTIREHVVADVQRQIDRQWWLGALTAFSEFGTFVRLAISSVVVALAIEVIVIVLSIQGDSLGAGHALHALFSASEAELQTGWTVFWQFGTVIAFFYFVFASMFGLRRRAHDYVVEGWWEGIRRAARVPATGDLSLVLTEPDRLAWRSPYRVNVVAIDRSAG